MRRRRKSRSGTSSTSAARWRRKECLRLGRGLLAVVLPVAILVGIPFGSDNPASAAEGTQTLAEDVGPSCFHVSDVTLKDVTEQSVMVTVRYRKSLACPLIGYINVRHNSTDEPNTLRTAETLTSETSFGTKDWTTTDSRPRAQLHLSL